MSLDGWMVKTRGKARWMDDGMVKTERNYGEKDGGTDGWLDGSLNFWRRLGNWLVKIKKMEY